MLISKTIWSDFANFPDYISKDNLLNCIVGKSLLLKEVCIREADILEKQWQKTMESKSSSSPDEEGKEQGTLLINYFRRRDV